MLGFEKKRVREDGDGREPVRRGAHASALVRGSATPAFRLFGVLGHH